MTKRQTVFGKQDAAMNSAPRIAVILAGGQSRRMGSADKATFKIKNKRLIDLVIDRVAPQTDQLVLSASHHYDTNFDFISDEPNKLAGPVAGLWAVASWIKLRTPNAKGVFTVPVDAPLIAHNLFDGLELVSGSAIAKTASGLHPTFAYWEIEPLLDALGRLPTGETLSLKALAERLNASHIVFENEINFTNINSPKDAKVFEGRL